MRLEDNFTPFLETDSSPYGGYESYAQPSYDGGQALGPFFGLPVGPVVPYQSPAADDGGRALGPFFGLPFVQDGAVLGKSSVGPSVSVMPRGPASLEGASAGSLFAGARYAFGGVARSMPARAQYQRGFTVEEQEKLRRRRRGRR